MSASFLMPSAGISRQALHTSGEAVSRVLLFVLQPWHRMPAQDHRHQLENSLSLSGAISQRSSLAFYRCRELEKCRGEHFWSS